MHVHKFLSYPANKRTDGSENSTTAESGRGNKFLIAFKTTSYPLVCAQLPPSADNVTLLAFAPERRAAAAPATAAIDRYLLPAGPTAANPPQRHAAVER